MLKIINIELLAGDSIFVSKGNIIDWVSDDNEVDGRKFKNKIMLDSLAKSKLLVESSSKVSFFILKARLLFTKLRQIFIKILILYYFDPKYHFYIKRNILGYAINRILNPQTLDNLNW